MIRYSVLLIIALTLCLPLQVWSATQTMLLSDDVQMSLGNAFMAEGDYYRAVTEYKKLTILFPDSEHLPAALYQIGMAYYKGKDYQSAIKNFVKVRQTYAASHFSSAAFYEGLSYKKLGQHDAATLAFERSRLFDEKHPDAINAQLGLALNAVEADDIVGAQTELEDFLVNYPQDERIPGVRQSFTLIDEYETKSQKSPALAGTMSAVIPGSGQVYAEHYKDGLMAFVVNGLFIAGTVAALNDDNYALAAIVGGVGVPFYIGNIYGAANATRKWNLSLSRKLYDDLSISLHYHY